MSSMMASPIPHYTEIDPAKFEAITPSQFIRFTVPNTLKHRGQLDDPLVLVSVCDSPLATAGEQLPFIYAYIVPKGRENDWNYSTEFGHMQLLYKTSYITRLILIGNYRPGRRTSVYKSPLYIDREGEERLEDEMQPLLVPLHPTVSITNYNGSPHTYFFDDEHGMAYRVTLQYYLSNIVGALLVEDVELVGYQQLRRRLRFRRMPYLVQSEALLLPFIGDDQVIYQTGLESLRRIENVEFKADTNILVHQYLIPMVSGLFLIASYLNSLSTPRALCLGVGGGVLLNFLDTQMDFKVTGVEIDNVVLTAAKDHFGFNKSGAIRVIVGDALEVIQNFPPQEYTDESNSKGDQFDVIFVDLDSTEAKNGFSAPPPEFVQKPVFQGVKSLLDDHGVLIMNVVPLNELFHTTLVNELKEVFCKVYKIKVEDGINFVAMATVSPTPPADDDNKFLKKLNSVIPATYLDSIVEL